MKRKRKNTIDASELKLGIGVLVGTFLVFKEPGVLAHIHLLNEEEIEEGISRVREEYKLNSIIRK